MFGHFFNSESLERLGLGDFWGDFFLTHLVTLIYVLKAG
jgi:hypothetical protein